MKKINFRQSRLRQAITATLLCALFIISFPNTADAKFWGTEVTDTKDWSDGECLHRQTCTDYYVFWIVVSSNCKEEIIDCP
jgi:hypothetical protein